MASQIISIDTTRIVRYSCNYTLAVLVVEKLKSIWFNSLFVAGGVGMRIVGGKSGNNGNLCAFATIVVKGGPAYIQGIREGT